MAKQLWMLYTKKADFNRIASELNISPMLARIMVNRDIKEEDMPGFLHSDFANMHSPQDLPDMSVSANLLISAVTNEKHIRIVGDYDIDGICSTYILYTALKHIGADVDYDIPDRIRDGYGINEQIVHKAKADKVDLILTCDNGIAAFEAVDLAKKLGMTVVITDHHEVRRENGEDILPKADAIVNPNRSDSSYPYSGICGAMVAFKLIQFLYSVLELQTEEEELFSLESLLEFVAVATIGDVMKLRDENRIAVKYGLDRLHRTKNIGLKSLIFVCGLEGKPIVSYHIGFIIGPCLNASGRLSTAKLALAMLLEEDEERAKEYALELKELNEERKRKTNEGVEKAVALAETEFQNDKVLVIRIKDCHESIAGIIAGRLKERYHKPCIVITDTSNGLLKGSGRSIENYHMFDSLSEVGNLFTKFGGHPMAAGMSLLPENLDLLRTKLNENANLCEDDFTEKIWIDIPLPFSYISEEFIEELEVLQPFGQGNEKPNFALKDIAIISMQVFGKDGNVVKLKLEDDMSNIMDGILFTDGAAFTEEARGRQKMDILYYPTVNEFNGKKSLQIHIKGWKFKEN